MHIYIYIYVMCNIYIYIYTERERERERCIYVGSQTTAAWGCRPGMRVLAAW